ncbi:MAG: neutral/alkaline non-lysosomal ceramidase N-terminal domain-containing protein [Xanthomonadaceae bacterium]|nr:neutral/alkaline non-lysosomal ceramidase N-terminal domain-containing protein [Xanthomonadaceae bacterium]
MIQNTLLFLLVAQLFSQTANASDALVGIASVDTAPEIGIPLAGYGSKDRRLPGFIDWKNEYKHSFFFRPSTGVHTPIRAKVMAIKNEDKIVIFISLDVIGIERRFLTDLAKRFKKQGIPEEAFILSGTHTHEGPGTLSRRLPLELVAVDLFRKKNFKTMLDRVAGAVSAALANLEPADLFKSKVTIEGVQRNKFRFQDIEYYNKNANFLLAKSKTTGWWLGGMVNFAVHGGGMPSEILHYSSDFPGQIEINIEKYITEQNGIALYKPTMLFMNGAEGDVGVKHDPIEHKETVENVENLGRVFGAQAEAAFAPQNLIPVEPTIEIRRRVVNLGLTAGSSLKWCVGGMFFKNHPPEMMIPYFALFPHKSTISQVKLGDITILTWPGEASSALGWQLQAQAIKNGATDPWFFGLVNDYMAYFTNKTEFYEGAYDSCSSLFTYHGGERIMKAHDELQTR